MNHAYGPPWRNLPDVFGNWNIVFHRFSRWSQKGVLWRIFEAMSDDTDPGQSHPPRYRPILPGQILERPPIRAVLSRRSTLADPTGGLGRRGPGGDQQRRSVQRQILDAQAVRD